MRQLEIMERILRFGGPQRADKALLQDIGHTMSQTSLCGLGQTAASAILSAIDRWPELFEPTGPQSGANGRIRLPVV